jgi:uncharacterized protein
LLRAVYKHDRGTILRRKYLILQICFLSLLLLLPVAPAAAQTYSDGMKAFQAGQYAKSRDIWEALATAGNPLAQYSLGKLYESGAGEVERDYSRAAQWYQRSSDQGVLAAQNNLGLMYSQGRGVPRDTARAVKLWTNAGTNGHAIAQFNLGLAYFRGEGVAENKGEALTWFRRAADLGLADGQYAMGEMARLGLVSTPDLGEALGWFRLAAAQNHEQARSQAAELTKQGVEPKAPPAVLSAETGEPVATASNVSLAKPAESAPRSQTAAAPQPAAAPSASPQPVKPDLPPPPSTITAAPEIKPVTQEPVVPTASAAPAATASSTNPTRITPTPTTTPTVSTAQPATSPQVAAQPAVPSKIETPAPQPEPQPAPAVLTAPKPASAAGGFGAWLISMDSEAAAKGFLRVSQSKNPAFFADAPATVVRVKLGRRVLYRVVAGGAPSRAAASVICRNLRKTQPDAFCKVVKK